MRGEGEQEEADESEEGGESRRGQAHRDNSVSIYSAKYIINTHTIPKVTATIGGGIALLQ